MCPLIGLDYPFTHKVCAVPLPPSGREVAFAKQMPKGARDEEKYRELPISLGRLHNYL
jgi:hypothetical protein